LALELASSLPLDAALPDDPAKLRSFRRAGRASLARLVHIASWPVELEAIDEARSPVGVAARRYVATFGEDFSAAVVEIEPLDARETVIVLSDDGRAGCAGEVEEAIAGGARTFVLEPFLFGESRTRTHAWLWALLVSSVEERPLGLQAGQVASLARVLAGARDERGVRVTAKGPRSSLIALVAAALEPRAIADLTLIDPYGSLREVIARNLSVYEAPELFTFGLLRELDIPQIVALVSPRRIEVRATTEAGAEAWMRMASWAHRIGQGEVVVHAPERGDEASGAARSESASEPASDG
ncbi:MAG TPA: hypothetical protein VK116_20210, partial [Planctomycetota bacterium]|nr:hypothetical protein [Planctomycetota bacterium]